MATTFRLHLLHGGTTTTLRQVTGDALGTAPPERADLRFSSDLSGRLYVTTKQDGWLRELVPPISTSAPPAAADVAPVKAVPNPFNPATEISFSLAEPSSARVTVFDAAGHRVRELFSPLSPAGECRVRWDGRDEDGRAVASGVYSYRLITREGVRFGKMSLVR